MQELNVRQNARVYARKNVRTGATEDFQKECQIEWHRNCQQEKGIKRTALTAKELSKVPLRTQCLQLIAARLGRDSEVLDGKFVHHHQGQALQAAPLLTSTVLL